MASIGNITAQGGSGVKYQFVLYPVGTPFKPLGAVYIFLREREPVYVGETGSLDTRFDGHHKAREIVLQRADRIGVLPEPDAQRRLAIESDLLRNYHWPCNG